MLMRCWGARGSIPVCGPEYLRYGGDTTCLELRPSADRVIVIDAGTGLRRLGNRLLDEGVDDVQLLFTHAHWDHLMGFPFFKPLYRPDTSLSVFGCPCAQTSVREMIAHAMSPPNFPVPLDHTKAALSFTDYCHEPFELDGLTVTPIKISHPNEGLGYKFTEDGRHFVFLTDNELGHVHPGGRGFDDYVAFCEGADLLVHDAEFTDQEYQTTRTWGHSTQRDAVDLAIRAGVKALGLFHHNQERGDDAVDAIVEACRRQIADCGQSIECFAVAQGTERRV